MRVPWWALPLIAFGVFAAGLLALRGAGVWRERGRSLPPLEQLVPPPSQPGPGGMPM